MKPAEADGFGELLKDRQQYERAASAIGAAILQSFNEQRVQFQTRQETKRRWRICMKGYQIIRHDLKWSFERTLDNMSDYLRRALLGIAWEPDKRQSWFGETA